MSDTTMSVDDELEGALLAAYYRGKDGKGYSYYELTSDIETITQLFSEKLQKLDHIQDILNMQQKVMLEHHGRPDCKNCSLAETIQEVLDTKGGTDDTPRL